MKRLFVSLFLVLFLSSLAFAESVILPQTGQNLCYSEGGGTVSCSNTGQDGALKSGLAWNTPRFIDNSANNVDTIADTLTNLVWAKDANVPEPSVGLCTTTETMNSMTWQQALTYVKCLNTNNYLGARDWALPNVNQLTSLINLQQTQNSQWLTTAGFTDVQSANYWTNDTYVYQPAKAWAVNINGSGTLQEDKLTANHVWPVRIAADLVVTNIAAPTSVVTGQQLTVTVTFKNNGTVSVLPNQWFKMCIYLSTDSTITNADTYLGEAQVNYYGPGIAAGAQQTVNYTVTIPSVTSGTYYIGAIVDFHNQVPESNETNNTLATNATPLTYGPDLQVTSMTAPTSVVTGQQFTVPVTFKNNGTGSVLPNQWFRISLYLSTDGTITTTDTSLGETQVNYYGPGIAAGAQQTVNYTVTIPSVTSGTYYIGAIVDISNQVPESNETNNTLATNAMPLTYGPDLEITSVTAPTSVVTGQQLTVPVTFKNNGAGSVLPNQWFLMTFYLSTDRTITTTDTNLGYTQLNYYGPGIAAGAQQTVNYTVTIPSVTNGAYYIGAIIDSNISVLESNETNNATATINPTEISQ